MPKKEDIASDDAASEDAPRLRPFWSGTISFGLVSVPVDLYPANRPKRVALRMLSPEGTPLARRYFDPDEDRDVERDDIVRGFELDGNMVVVTNEELEALEPEKTRDIDLRRFVPADAIDARFFDRGYFLTPAEGSNKAYRLLAEVMERTGRAGIATFVMRAKEYLIAIFAEKGILRAETLRFADELRSPDDVGLPEPVKPKPAAVKRMTAAINKLKKAELAEQELRDEWADRLLALVEKKAKSGEDTVDMPEEEEAPADSDVIDLMAVLKRSLEGAKERTSERAAPKRAPARKSTPKRAAAKRPSAGKVASRTSSKTSSSERAGGTGLGALSKDELYERAQELDIEGRSGMTKSQLVQALEKAG